MGCFVVKRFFKITIVYVRLDTVNWVMYFDRGGQTFLLTGQISLKYCIAGRKKILIYFFLHKDNIINVNFLYFIYKWIINSLVVHTKFDIGAEENLWRAALWPLLYYKVDWGKFIYKIMIIPTLNLGSALSKSKQNILFTVGLVKIENCK